MDQQAVHEKFTGALDALIAQVQQDRSILAAILCGSLSYGKVWAKSDIDLLLVTVDDKKIPASSLSLDASGVNVHALMMPRSEFRQVAEGAIRQSFFHSFLAKGRLLYSHDESLIPLCDRLKDIGERDTRIQLLQAGCQALPPIYKAHKWMITSGDLDHTSLWLLHCATPLAKIEVYSARQLADREALLHALQLNPKFFRTIYTDLLNTSKTGPDVQAALDAVDEYMASRAPLLFGPILEYLREAGEARSVTEIDDHFKRNFDIESVATACEYLADLGRIGKASITTRLTKRSNVDVQEMAFFDLGGEAR